MRGRPNKDRMKNLIAEREEKAKIFADKVLKEHKTIRQIAAECEESKTTVHKYLTNYIDSKSTKDKLVKALSKNFKNKHIHGGEATKEGYANGTIIRKPNKPKDKITKDKATK